MGKLKKIIASFDDEVVSLKLDHGDFLSQALVVRVS
jgi:hypothetical protein